jgi:hypothetical protein
MSSFSVPASGSVTFTALEESWSEPATSSVNVRGFPGGNAIAISLGGQREVNRTVSCLFTDRGQYVSFALLRGKAGTLVIDHWDSVGAVLKESDPDPPRADGQVKARASFVLT